MDLITAENVNFSYEKNNYLTLKNINLTLNDNSMNVVIGPSGVGKSTLLKLIAGYIKPTRGSLVMNNKIISDASWERTIVFQDMALYPWLNVSDNILFGPRVRGMSSKETLLNFEQLLNQTGLNEYRNSYIYELSGGLKQRVALARAFINKPPLLMLDESFSALDNFTRDEMHNILFGLWRSSENCILAITHDIDEAIYLGQNIVVMNNKPGTIIESVNNPYFGYDFSKLMHNEEYLKFREQLLIKIA